MFYKISENYDKYNYAGNIITIIQWSSKVHDRTHTVKLMKLKRLLNLTELNTSSQPHSNFLILFV